MAADTTESDKPLKAVKARSTWLETGPVCEAGYSGPREEVGAGHKWRWVTHRRDWSLWPPTAWGSTRRSGGVCRAGQRKVK